MGCEYMDCTTAPRVSELFQEAEQSAFRSERILTEIRDVLEDFMLGLDQHSPRRRFVQDDVAKVKAWISKGSFNPNELHWFHNNEWVKSDDGDKKAVVLRYELTGTTEDPVYLAKDFVDCECKEGYIHLASGRADGLLCNKCGVLEGDAPNSRIPELFQPNTLSFCGRLRLFGDGT